MQPSASNSLSLSHAFSLAQALICIIYNAESHGGGGSVSYCTRSCEYYNLTLSWLPPKFRFRSVLPPTRLTKFRSPLTSSFNFVIVLLTTSPLSFIYINLDKQFWKRLNDLLCCLYLALKSSPQYFPLLACTQLFIGYFFLHLLHSFQHFLIQSGPNRIREKEGSIFSQVTRRRNATHSKPWMIQNTMGSSLSGRRISRTSVWLSLGNVAAENKFHGDKNKPGPYA